MVENIHNSDDVLEILSNCLCPAGNGVHTVETAKEKKQSLHSQLYGVNLNQEQIKQQWQKDLKLSLSENKPLVLGICSDTGGGILRGANWGPLCIREQFYRDNNKDNLIDIGDVRVIPHLLHDKYLNSDTIAKCQAALYGNSKKYPVSPLSVAQLVLKSVYDYKPDAKIFSLGGDHSISYATVHEYLQSKNKNNTRTAIIHFDAHTDLSAQRLGIDINFSTWAYAILPLLHNPQDLIQIGIRSSRHNKDYWQGELGVQQFWSKEVKEQGISAIAEHIIAYLNTHNIQELFVSFDIDAIDSKYVSATGTPEKDGLMPNDAYYLLDRLASDYKITGGDLAEVAPFITTNGNNKKDSTVEIAAEICKMLTGAMS